MRRPRIWYVIADGTHARFLTRDAETRLFKDARAPLTAEELRRPVVRSNQPGRVYESATTARHAVEPRNDPRDLAKRMFAQSIAQVLKLARTRRDYDRLVLAAPPRFLGYLRDAIHPSIRRALIAELPKDLSHVPEGDLSRHLAGLRAAPTQRVPSVRHSHGIERSIWP